MNPRNPRFLYKKRRMERIRLYLRTYPGTVTDAVIIRALKTNGISPTERLLDELRPAPPVVVDPPKPKRRRKKAAPKVTEENDG